MSHKDDQVGSTFRYPNLEAILSSNRRAMEVLEPTLIAAKPLANALAGQSRSTIWSTLSCVPAFADHLQFAETQGKAIDLPLDPKNPEPWIARVRMHSARMEKQLRQIVDLVQRDLPPLSGCTESMIHEVLERHPRFQGIRILYGPEWLSRQELFAQGFMAKAKAVIPLGAIRPRIEGSIKTILCYWQTMRESTYQDSLHRFRIMWKGLRCEERVGLLCQHFPDLHVSPNPDIAQWLQNAAQEKPRWQSEAFMTPLLNISDLAQKDVLPNMLENRVARHPRHFRLQDCRAVFLGYCCGALQKLDVEGSASFNPVVNDDTINYEVRFENETGISTSYMNPAITMHMMNAQERIYRFLSVCPSALVERDRGDSRHHSVAIEDDEHPSLLTWSVRSQSSNPTSIEWSYVRSLLKTQLDDCRDHLARLRTNESIWHDQMAQLPASGRASALIHSTFSRINVFRLLSKHVERFDDANGHLTSSSGMEQLKDVIFIDVALCSVLDQTVLSLKHIAKASSRLQELCSASRQIFEMVLSNDAVLRVMGFDSVLRFIEQDMKNVHLQNPFPFLFTQAISDVAVISACLREIRKYCGFVDLLSQEYGSLLVLQEEKWKSDERIWNSILTDVDLALKSKSNKLDVAILDKTLTPQKRFHSFWKTIDQAFESETTPDKDDAPAHAQVKRELKDLLDMNPIEVPFDPFPAIGTFDWTVSNAVHDFTDTQVKRSKGRREIMSQPRLSATPPSSKMPSPLPCLKIYRKEDQQFWIDLWEKSGTVEFGDMAKFLTRAGASMMPLGGGGAGFRFEYRQDGAVSWAVILHKLHRPGKEGKAQIKLPRSLARSWWGDTLLKTVRVVLVR